MLGVDWFMLKIRMKQLSQISPVSSNAVTFAKGTKRKNLFVISFIVKYVCSAHH
jgi:hypothetical protein